MNATEERPSRGGWHRWLLGGVLVSLAAASAIVLVARTLFAGLLQTPSELPPLVVVRAAAVNIRELPNAASAVLAAASRSQPLYLRCRGGVPLVFGPWLGVLDAKSEKVGWVHAQHVSPATGGCPSSEALPSRWTLRRVVATLSSPVNVRFGPSVRTLVVAKLNPGMNAWTDGRHVTLGGERWVPLLLESGVTGWVRADMLQSRPLAASLLPPREGGPSKLRADRGTDEARVSVEIDESLAMTLGVSFRPQGPHAELQHAIAKQLQGGIAAQALAMSNPPMAVQTGNNGEVSVQLALHRQASRYPASLLETHPEELAMSLLVGDGVLARHVEEVYSPEAALVLRAAFVLTGIPEPMVDVAFVLSQDPAVRAQVAVLAASGMEVASVMAQVASPEAQRHIQALHLAATSLSVEVARRPDLDGAALLTIAAGHLQRTQRTRVQMLARMQGAFASERGVAVVFAGRSPAELASSLRQGSRSIRGQEVLRWADESRDIARRIVTEKSRAGGESVEAISRAIDSHRRDVGQQAGTVVTESWDRAGSELSDRWREGSGETRDHLQRGQAQLGEALRRQQDEGAARAQQLQREAEERIRRAQEQGRQGVEQMGRQMGETMRNIRLPARRP